MIQEHLCISELFRDIQDATLLILSLQDNVMIQSNFFQYIYHVGRAFNLHSIISSGLIPGGQSLSKRQTVFFLPVDPMDKRHKDPDVIDLSVPRRAQYMHKASKKHQNTVYWVDIKLAQKKGLKFYQTRSNAIILHDTLPAYCIPKVVRMETGEVKNEKVYTSPRLPPKISLKHEWKRELGSEHAQRSEVGQLFRSFQSNQPVLNQSRERTGRPVVKDDTRTVQDGRKTSRSQEIDANSFDEETGSSQSTERPVVDHDNLSHEQTMLNEVNMDFRIPGLPHSVVKHAQSTSVRELIQKIENHPDRLALKQDLRQNQACHSFSPEPKKMNQEVATSNCLNCSRRIPKRSAQHAYHTGT